MSGVRVPPSFQLAAVMLIAVYCEGCLSQEAREETIQADQNLTQSERAYLWNWESFLSCADKPSYSFSFVGCMNRNGR
jgi:hypothetical protein